MTSKEKSILMTADTVGGVWTYTVELCRSFADLPWHFYVVTLGAMPSEEQRMQVKELENVTLICTNLKLEWMENPWEDLPKLHSKLEVLIEKFKPDLLHFNNFVSPAATWKLPVLTVFHSCVQTWWRAVKGCHAPEEWDRYYDLVQNALDHSDVIVFPSEGIKNAAEIIYPLYSESLVIHNGRHLVYADEKPKENFILCCGRMWDEAKNLSLLSDIASDISWPIYVAGETEAQTEISEAHGPNLRFLGKLNSSEMNYWFQRAAIYINPARYEPFGLAVLEAARAGCALVLSDIPTLKEIWDSSALYFKDNDAFSLKEKIQSLIADSQKRKSYQLSSKVRSTTYSLQAMQKQYEEVYHHLIFTSQTKPMSKTLSL